MQVCRTSPPLALFLLEEVEGQSRKKKKLGDEGGDGEQLMAAQHDAAAGHCTHCGVREASHPSLAHSLANLPRSLLLPRPVTFAELGTEPFAREEEEGGLLCRPPPATRCRPRPMSRGKVADRQATGSVGRSATRREERFSRLHPHSSGKFWSVVVVIVNSPFRRFPQHSQVISLEGCSRKPPFRPSRL